MEDKKKVILICAIVAIILVIAVVMVIFLKPKKDSTEGLQLEGNFAGEMGIGYGGDFNEFDTSGDVDKDGAADADVEEVDVQQMVDEGEKAKEEFLNNLPGDIIKEDGNIEGQKNEDANMLKPSKDIVDNNDGVTDEETPVDNVEYEENEEGELVLTPMESQGYAEYEVLCDAVDMAEAEAVAEQISGTVLEVQNGVATIQIDIHVDELLEQLESQGSTLKLYRKYYYSLQ